MLSSFHLPIASGFYESYRRHPNKNALFVDGQYYTYQTLIDTVYPIYCFLKQLPRQEERIGVYVHNDVYSYASILAISLYGAAYVPIHAQHPLERNRYIIKESQLRLLLMAQEQCPPFVDELSGIDVTKLTANSERINIEGNMPHQPIAYILFTSGTTGQPKGVPVTNSNVHHLLDFYLTKGGYGFSPQDRFLQVYALTFDVSVFSFFLPLYLGACCYVLPQKGVRFLQIIKMLQQHAITVVSMVPTTLYFMHRYFSEMQFPDLRYSFFSGDALTQDLAMGWKSTMPNGVIHNFYGPTETTIVCTRYIWRGDAAAKEAVNGIVPLGKPFPKMNYLMIDAEGVPVEVGEKGELCFTGAQVVPKYLNGRRATAFFQYQGNRYYKTGDLVSENTEGNLLFWGRVDHQVKINGHRVELGEIEACIQQFTPKLSAVCAVKENDLTVLHAFVEDAKLNKEALLQHLQRHLPDYMLPKSIVLLEKMPLNANGKIDRKKLGVRS